MSSHLPSASTHLFLDSAEQLAVRLEQDPSDAARALAAEARALVARFTGWQDARPADDERLAAIQQLFDLNRRVMDYLAG